MAETVIRTPSLRGVVLGGVLFECSLLSLYLVPHGGPAVLAFILIHAGAFLLLSFFWWKRERFLAPARHVVPVVIIFGVVFRATLIPHGPVASDDIYRYLWDGRVAVHGINPYAFAPNDPHLAPLASPLLPAAVNHPDIGSIYPPLAQGFFALSYVLVGEHPAGLKGLLMLVDIGTLLLLLRLLRTLQLPLYGVILYAWSPLPILYGALDGHIDVLGIPFLILLLLLAARGRPVLSALATAGAGLVKILPMVLAPLYVRLDRGWRGVGLAALTVVAFGIGFLPYVNAFPALDRWLSIYGQHWEFNGGLFTVIYAWLQDNQKTHLVLNLLLFAWILWLTVRNAPLTEKVFLGLLGLVLFGPVVHPWYLLWIAAVLVVRWSPSVFVLLGLSVLANIVEYRYVTTGHWADDPWLIAAEYVPFAIVLAWELIRRPPSLPAGRG